MRGFISPGKYIILFFICFIATGSVVAQSLKQRIETAYRTFAGHESLANGLASLTVINGNTGEVVFSVNDRLGLAPASTLKNITAATAYYILGSSYTFETSLYYTGHIDTSGTLHGDIIIKGSGDPSLGSDRYPETPDHTILAKWVSSIAGAGIKKIEGSIIANDKLYGGKTAPRGWTWQDMGNYYGAGISALNWRENAAGINFRTGGRIGDKTSIANTTSDISYLQLVNETTTGKAGSGDNVYAFAAPYSSRVYLRGTHGIDLKKTIYISLPDGAYDAAYNLQLALNRAGIFQTQVPTTAHILELSGVEVADEGSLLYQHTSPSLGELVYWFNQKSINLYGEALLKAMVYTQSKLTDTRDGAEMIRDYWVSKLGIARGELRIMDGSGLSPENRVSTHAMARILASIRNEPWFASFLESLPINNGMKMKSGTIGGVLGYAGYHTSKDGTPLVFALLVNNYQGAAQPMRNRMFQLLNTLK